MTESPRCHRYRCRRYRRRCAATRTHNYRPYNHCTCSGRKRTMALRVILPCTCPRQSFHSRITSLRCITKTRPLKITPTSEICARTCNVYTCMCTTAHVILGHNMHDAPVCDEAPTRIRRTLRRLPETHKLREKMKFSLSAPPQNNDSCTLAVRKCSREYALLSSGSTICVSSYDTSCAQQASRNQNRRHAVRIDDTLVVLDMKGTPPRQQRS